jgi:RNA polymerase sigma-70 factor (ECF subfamily)
MPPIAPVGDSFAEVLECSRHFLLTIANAELPPSIRAKGGASDFVQDTFAAAHRARNQFNGRTVPELRGWLRAILIRELAMARRKFLATASRDVRREVTPVTNSIPAPDAVPAAELIRREQDEHLAAAVARLPVDHRRVVAMRIERDMTFAAIGQELGVTEDVARRLFARALELLRATTPDAADCSTT